MTKQRIAKETDAVRWLKANPAKAATILERALKQCIAPATSDWLLSLCAAEGMNEDKDDRDLL